MGRTVVSAGREPGSSFSVGPEASARRLFLKARSPLGRSHVKPVEIHHLGPRLDEVVHELLLSPSSAA